MMKSNSMFSVFVLVVILSVLFSGFIVQPQARKSVELKKRIEVMTDALKFVEFVPDKQQILAGPVAPRADIVAGLYRISNGKRLDTFPVREKNPESGIALSPDGTLVTSTDDGELKVWNIQNGETIFSSDPLSWAPPVSFNPEGDKLAFGYCLKKEGEDCAESEIRVLNPGNGEINTLAAETMEDLHSLLWGEGGLLACSLVELMENNVIKIFDIESGELKATFKSNYGRTGKMMAEPPEMVFGDEGNFFAANLIAGP
ncbi:MAG: WD40 repeat domain-containing protein, partial [Candidatus Bipolaricaulia bacterium]